MCCLWFLVFSVQCMEESVFVCGAWCRVFVAHCMFYGRGYGFEESHLIDADYSHEVTQQSQGIVPEKSPELAG